MDWTQITIDARGLSCPIPQMRTLEALKTLERGEILVLIDEHAACDSVVRTAKALGLPYLVQAEGQDFMVKISKREELWITRLTSEG